MYVGQFVQFLPLHRPATPMIGIQLNVQSGPGVVVRLYLDFVRIKSKMPEYCQVHGQKNGCNQAFSAAISRELFFA